MNWKVLGLLLFVVATAVSLVAPFVVREQDEVPSFVPVSIQASLSIADYPPGGQKLVVVKRTSISYGTVEIVAEEGDILCTSFRLNPSDKKFVDLGGVWYIRVFFSRIGHQAWVRFADVEVTNEECSIRSRTLEGG